MAEFVRIEDKNGKTQYRNKTENKIVSADKLPSALKEELDIADPGTVIDEETVFAEKGDGVVDKDGNPIEPKEDGDGNGATPDQGSEPDGEGDKDGQEPPKGTGDKPEVPKTPTRRPRDAGATTRNPYSKPVPTSEDGMGYPRVNGKTVDIFDGKTPHTHVRLVGDKTVPLSEENYKTKTDSEIWERLEELKLV